MSEVIRILTIDEDALFDCSKESLDHFPRIRSVEDYKDSEYIKEQWEDYYDKYENAWELSILRNAPQIYFRVPFLLKPCGEIFRVGCHDEALKHIAMLFPSLCPFGRQMQVVIDNIDQHHDLYVMHGTDKLDCSNWAYPKFVKQFIPNVELYKYNWFYTNLSDDYGFISDCALNGIKYTGYKIPIRQFTDVVVNRSQIYDMIIFCTSRAYVPKNYWQVFDGMYDSVIRFNSKLRKLNDFADEWFNSK